MITEDFVTQQTHESKKNDDDDDSFLQTCLECLNLCVHGQVRCMYTQSVDWQSADWTRLQEEHTEP